MPGHNLPRQLPFEQGLDAAHSLQREELPQVLGVGGAAVGRSHAEPAPNLLRRYQRDAGRAPQLYPPAPQPPTPESVIQIGGIPVGHAILRVGIDGLFGLSP